MAWTERYVRADAAGSGDGTTDTNSGVNGAWTLAEGITNEAAGMRLNVKAGTYASTTTTRTMAGAGTATAQIWWRGFKTTAGDQDTNRAAVAGTDIPLFTFTTGQLLFSGANHIVSNLAVTSQCITANGAVAFTGVTPEIYGLRAENTAANSNSRAITISSGGTGATIAASWFKATSSATVAVLAAGSELLGSVTRGGNVGVAAGTSCLIRGCLIDSPAGDGITSTGSGLFIDGCDIYNPGGHGINVTATSANAVHISNTHIEYASTAPALKYGIANTSGTNTNLVHVVACSFYNCSNGNTNGITESFMILDNGTLAGSGFTNAGSRDFTASTRLSALGYPGTFENETLTGYLTNGALQRQGAGATRYPTLQSLGA